MKKRQVSNMKIKDTTMSSNRASERNTSVIGATSVAEAAVAG